jgi:aspartyl/glutamyl-tRNA(Asn/Gln) amidotransferase C subunit
MSEENTKQEITEHLFEHLVQLAALELSAQEAEYLRGELNKQLKAIDELAAIPLDDSIQITSHGVPYSPQITPAMRRDEWIACPNPQDILDQAPQAEQGYVIVPDIPHEELD